MKSRSKLSIFNGLTTLAALACAAGFCPALLAESAAPTRTVLTASPNRLTAGDALTLTATVTSAKGDDPRGAVSFQSGTTAMGSAGLTSGGVAQLVLRPAAGIYTIEAKFDGSGSYLPSVSAPDVPVTVVDLKTVLAKLDASAAKFKSAQADIVWDNVQTQPVPDKDSQVGTALFERGKDGDLQLALHVQTDNGRPALKDVVYSGGIGKMYQPGIKQMQVFKVGDNRAALNTFLTLGFGGSGKDLEKNWKIDFQGTEKLNGLATARLQLTPRDAKVAETTPRVLLWVDLDQGVAVKQQRFGVDGGYVMFTYSNIHMNAKVARDAFEIKTAPGTQIQNH